MRVKASENLGVQQLRERLSVSSDLITRLEGWVMKMPRCFGDLGSGGTMPAFRQIWIHRILHTKENAVAGDRARL